MTMKATSSRKRSYSASIAGNCRRNGGQVYEPKIRATGRRPACSARWNVRPVGRAAPLDSLSSGYEKSKATSPTPRAGVRIRSITGEAITSSNRSGESAGVISFGSTGTAAAVRPAFGCMTTSLSVSGRTATPATNGSRGSSLDRCQDQWTIPCDIPGITLPEVGLSGLEVLDRGELEGIFRLNVASSDPTTTRTVKV